MSDTQNLPSQPLISFIVTAYNLPAALVADCLASITALSLRREEREILLIDDGSDVSPLSALLASRDDIVYVRQPHAGLSAARNRGIAYSTGTFIQFIDGDDCLLTANYEHCLDIVRYKPEADMVLFQTTRSQSADVSFSYDGPISGTDFMQHNNVRAAACGYIFRRSILGNLRFTDGLLHEDEEFTPQLLLHAHGLYTTPSKAYYYRKRSTSITGSHNVDLTERRLHDVFGVVVHLHELAATLPSPQKEAMERRVAQLSMDYLYQVIKLTHSRSRLAQAMAQLEEKGLYPLPATPYTRKYALFRRLIESKVGRHILNCLIN